MGSGFNQASYPNEVQAHLSARQMTLAPVFAARALTSQAMEAAEMGLRGEGQQRRRRRREQLSQVSPGRATGARLRQLGLGRVLPGFVLLRAALAAARGAPAAASARRVSQSARRLEPDTILARPSACALPTMRGTSPSQIVDGSVEASAAAPASSPSSSAADASSSISASTAAATAAAPARPARKEGRPDLAPVVGKGRVRASRSCLSCRVRPLSWPEPRGPPSGGAAAAARARWADSLLAASIHRFLHPLQGKRSRCNGAGPPCGPCEENG